MELKNSHHAGLWLTRYLSEHKTKDTEERNKSEVPEETHLNAAVNIAASDAYKRAFQRWQALHPHPLKLTLASSLAIGLGNESPLEIGLTLHHTYGVPVIPGSAIKGMCRRAAETLKAQGLINDEQFYCLFGRTKDNGGQDEAGAAVFYDAWYDPGSVEGKPLHRDVITVHHQKYYDSKGNTPPTDFDDPIPVPFIVVKKSARFLFALDALDDGWRTFANELLKWSLINLGVGGKTNAGYGYFEDSSSPSASQHTISSQTETWEGVTLTLNPGSGTMKATHEGRTAEAHGSHAQDLQQALSDERQEQFRQTKKLTADIEVEITGNQRRIIAIRDRKSVV